MNAGPTSHELGFHTGEYRFEVIRSQFPAYLAVDGEQIPAHTKTEIWVGKAENSVPNRSFHRDGCFRNRTRMFDIVDEEK